jgi:hypothetical protein
LSRCVVHALTCSVSLVIARLPSEDDLDGLNEQYGSKKKMPVFPLSRGSSGRFGAGAGSQKVKFEQLPSGTNIYRSDSEVDEKEDASISISSSMKDLRGMLSRQPSYRESTIVDGASGKETIRVMKKPPSSNALNVPSVSSTRQNSGGTIIVVILTSRFFLVPRVRFTSSDVAVAASAVEPSVDPVPPFISRASSRVFSISNMLRNANADASRDHSMGDISGKAGDIPMMGMPSSPIILHSAFGRGASSKSVKFGNA